MSDLPERLRAFGERHDGHCRSALWGICREAADALAAAEAEYRDAHTAAEVQANAHRRCREELAAAEAERDAAMRELTATEVHLMGAELASGHPRYSSLSIGHTIDQIVAELDRLRAALTDIAVNGRGDHERRS